MKAGSRISHPRPICTLICALVSALGLALAGCASVDDPPAAIDAGSEADAPTVVPGCGNDLVEPGEACDGANLNDQDCASRGFESGELGCDACAFDTSGCYTCGDGTRAETEECDGAELGDATCQGLGYLGGVLACDSATCSFDITGCDTRQIVQNHDGNCTASLGCGNDAGSNGNEQRMFECFRDVTMPPPFWLTEVSYGIGAGTPAPGALNLEIYTWTGDGTPGSLIRTIALEGDDLGVGDHLHQLVEPVELDAAEFCVALHGEDPLDGFEATYSSTTKDSDTSFMEAPLCGIGVATDLNGVLSGPGTWCIGATVDKLLP